MMYIIHVSACISYHVSYRHCSSYIRVYIDILVVAVHSGGRSLSPLFAPHTEGQLHRAAADRGILHTSYNSGLIEEQKCNDKFM